MGINTRDRGRYSAGGIFHVRGGSIGFGTSVADGGKGDVVLYRKATDELALASGDSITIPGSATVGGALLAVGPVLVAGSGDVGVGTGGTALKITSFGGTITWREDTTNLYWSAAGVLKTDASFDATTSGLETKLATGAVAVATLANVGGVQFQFCGGTARLIGNVSGTMYFVDLVVKP